MNKFIKLFLPFILFCISVEGQNQIGDWSELMSYTQAKNICIANDEIICVTGEGFFSYNTSDNSITTWSKLNGLSDVGISVVKYSKLLDLYVIAYNNTNIDIIQNNQVINIPDIKLKMIQGNKVINDIYFIGNDAYLACGFGIVVLDLTRLELSGTYYIGENAQKINVAGICLFESKIYAATEQGIYAASLYSENLKDFRNWDLLSFLPDPNANFISVCNVNDAIYVASLDDVSGEVYKIKGTEVEQLQTKFASFNSVTESNNKLLITGVEQINKAKGVFIFNSDNQLIKSYTEYYWLIAIKDAAYDDKGNLWIADEFSGLGKITESSNGKAEFFHPQGPHSNSVYDLEFVEHHLWIAGGGRSQKYDNLGAYTLSGGYWTNFMSLPENILKNVKNISSIAIDPLDHTHVVGGSYGFGVVEFRNDKVVKVYNDKNSPLKQIDNLQNSYIHIEDVAFDSEGNCWIVSSEVSTPIYVLNSNGDLQIKSLKNTGITPNDRLNHIHITPYDQKWISLKSGDAQKILVIDKDDNVKNFNLVNSQGSVQHSQIQCFAEDEEGTIWVGTNEGIYLYYSPENIFYSDYTPVAQRIVITEDGESSYLFSSEVVKSIAVDKGNRKWIGTNNSGLFVLGPDGTKEIHHFTFENSPLFSNTINDIAINDKVGHVYIGTEKGILIYKNEAIEASANYDNVVVYPNPIRETYNGNIYIKGLLPETNLKITDISGNIVYETNSLGGQAEWDGKTFSGHRVRTGVYLIFCVNKDGSKSVVAKLLFIN